VAAGKPQQWWGIAVLRHPECRRGVIHACRPYPVKGAWIAVETVGIFDIFHALSGEKGIFLL